MMTAQKKQLDVFLRPGDCFVGDERHLLRTLLGSCVSITLWHPRRNIGAMSHFLLPGRRACRFDAPDGRYADEALLLMRKGLADRGIRLPECRAKIFGGADMFPARRAPNTLLVGQRNGEAARTLLRAHGVEITSEHLFGIGHRQIIFNVRTGDVWARQVQASGSGWLEQQ